MPSFTPPPGYTRIKLVQSFDELVTTPFGGEINALCWQRTLPDGFGEIVEQLHVRGGIATLDAPRLNTLSLSVAGGAAREILLEDQQLLRSAGLSPVLDCIHAYPRDEDDATVPTDVYSFHADKAPVAADTYLCSYNESATEGLRNDEAQRRVDDPGTRAELLRLFGGADDDDFLEFLRENCYDLHYAPVLQARPFSFGVGNLWRIAIEYPGSPVPPCLHRAPATAPGRPGRLLMIS